jgi:M6 family metalloprotease-like protein
MPGKRAAILCSVLTTLVTIPASSQPPSGETLQCATVAAASPSRVPDQVGGMHITARGTLRILLVFASFQDDETPHPYWPAHQPPDFLQQFIDPDTLTQSQGSWNLTNYFRQMSLGQFHVVGEAIWVESPHSWTEYTNGSYGRANWSALQERVDPIVDFSLYDNWTNAADYQNTNVPDGMVDMIVMVWRTTVFAMLGEASLGYKPGFAVDGKRIELGFPERYDAPLGSGVTCEYPYGDDPPRVMKTMAHELGHWLLGGPHPYNGGTNTDKHQYWGILCAGQRISSCANAYERERLGWIAVPEVPRDVDVTLSDFATTGAAYKFHPPEGMLLEEFYFENHQHFALFDDVTANADDKGLWILHQLAPYSEMDFLRIRPADGTWHWENPGTTTACYAQGLPLFARGAPNVLSGESHRDQIVTPTSAVNWLMAYRDPLGQTSCGAFFAGQSFAGAFNTSGNNVFSRWSNPNSNTWDNQATSFSLEIVKDSSGILTLRSPSNPLESSPARRHLGLDPTGGGIVSDHLPLAWGAQWSDGQFLESDVVWSELQRKIGFRGNWVGIFADSATTWTDSSLTYNASGTAPVFFRVRVRDSQGKYSLWSPSFVTLAVLTNVREDHTDRGRDVPGEFFLGSNYPNPFNPTTIIEFGLPVRASVRLTMYDILGREVLTIVDGVMEGGMHVVTWDGADRNGAEVPGGVYFCRMSAEVPRGGRHFSSVRKMLLLR